MVDFVGRQLGRFKVTNVLGRGGFADVYLAEHIFLKTKVAIKVLRTYIAEDNQEEFLKEARMIAKLKHPHIVGVLDFGIGGEGEDKQPFLVMDYAPHGTLRQKYPYATALPISQFLPFVKQIASALQYAHQMKIIHRDIKPENILLESDTHALVSDFGLAVIDHSTKSRGVQSAKGTAIYTAPEQFRGKAVPASDQYSLAVIVYEWLCGSPPFTEGDFIQLGYQHAYLPVPPLREKYPGIAPEVEQVVLKALAKEPQNRYASICDFADALEQGSTQLVFPITVSTEKLYTFRLDANLTAHAGRVWSLIFHPDNQTLISGSLDTTIKLWNTRTKQLSGTLIGHEGIVTSLVFTPERGTLLSGSSDKTIKVWDIRKQSLRYTLSKHNGYIFSTAISPNGRICAIGEMDHTISTWHLLTKQPLQTFTGHKGIIFAAAITPDGQLLLTGSGDKTIKLWNLHTGQLLRTLIEHTSAVSSIVISSNGNTFVSGSYDKTIKVWNIYTGKLLHTLQGHKGTVFALALSPDRQTLASGSHDGTIKVWNIVTGQLLTTLHDHTHGVLCVAFSPNGQMLASGGMDAMINVWISQ